MNLLNTTKRMLVVTLLFVAVSGSTYAAAAALRRAALRAEPTLSVALFGTLATLAACGPVDSYFLNGTKPHVTHPHGHCKHWETKAGDKESTVTQGHATPEELAACERDRRSLPRPSL